MTLLALALDTRDGNPALFTGLPGRVDGVADLLTIEDGFAVPGNDGLDASLLANWLGARTRHVALLPGTPLNFLEPFHVSTTVATLDHVTQGRAGLLAQPLRGARAEQARRALGPLNGYPEPDPAALAKDAAEAVEVIRQLWDSWEDDAVIRDPVSQRFVDGSKLHYIRFKGSRFDVLGPSITPRPPQGQPVVATSLQPGDDPAVADAADLVFLAAPTVAGVQALAARLRTGGREPVLFADVLVSSGRDTDTERPALRWTGPPAGLAEQAGTWARQLGVAGLRFRPASVAADLPPLLADVLPALGPARPAGTLRARLGLPTARNRYVPAATAA